MIIHTRYICEYCGKAYDNETAALDCEAGHRKEADLTVVGVRFEKGSTIPEIIEVAITGETHNARYELVKLIATVK